MKALGIDIGTTSICLACLEEGAEKLSFVRSRRNSFLPGTFEQDPEAVVGKVMELLAEGERCGFPADEMDAVGISSQMHGILYVDEEGRAVSPFYTWKNEMGRQVMAGGISYEEFLTREMGTPLFSGYGTVTHFCLKEQGRLPERAVKMANIGDYLAMRLTGRKSPLAEESMAASFGGYDLTKGRFDVDKLVSAGVDTSFYPPIAGAGEAAGTWRGIPVSCAVGDNQASFLGAVDKPLRQISVNVGTGSQVTLFDSRCLLTAAADVRPFFHQGFLYVGASLNGGKVYERLADFFAETVLEFTGLKIPAWEQMARLGEECADTRLLFRPSLYGARGKPEQHGEIRALTSENFHPGDLVRGCVRGMAEELHGMYLSFPEEIRGGRKEIVASGNGVRKNSLLAEELEKSFGMPVVFRQIQEEAASGAAKAALNLKYRNINHQACASGERTPGVQEVAQCKW